jgi:uncharacterized protein (UPF0332 family)
MTPEQSALLSKAYDSVRAAKLLSDAELYDFAVSRAYYAMFYMAEAFLLGVGLSFSRHAGVIAAFGERFAKTGIVPVEFHRYLIEGQDKSNVGDYQIGPGLTNIQAAEQIARAEQFLHLAQRLFERIGISKAFFMPRPREIAWQAARSARGSEPQDSGCSDWFKRLGRLLIGQGYAGI